MYGRVSTAEDGEENELMLNLFRHSYQKRGDFQVHTFPCNGFDYAPRCLHGGKGPKDLKTNKGRLCACLCPSPWQGPECKDLVI